MDNFLRLKIRWKGFYFLGFVLAMGVFYTLFLLDWHVKTIIENYGTSLNGAQVNIGELKTRLFRGSLEARGVQITDLRTPTKNLFEIERISCQISFLPLLRKKFVITDLSVQGVHTGTAREFPGLLPIEVAQDLPMSLADRVASGLYGSLKAQINENPLKFLGQLSVGMNLRELITDLTPNLPSLKAAKELDDKKWDETKRSDPRLIASLKQSVERHTAGSSQEDASLLKKRTEDETAKNQEFLEASREAEKEIEVKTSELNETLHKDVEYLKTKLALPNLEVEDLTSSIIGPKFLEWMERLSYWVDLSRRRMPNSVSRGPFWVIVQPKQHGQAIHFGKYAGTPSFLIQRAEIKSQPQSASRLGSVEGVLFGLTSDPSILGNPTILQLNASFPSSGIGSANLGLEIDHTRKALKEKVDFSFEIEPFSDFYLSDVADLKFKIESAKVTLRFTGEFNEDEINIGWNGVVSNVKYHVSSRYKQIEEVVREIAAPITAFDVKGDLKGPANNLTFSATSGLGSLLAVGLKNEFRHQLGAIDDMIQQNLLEIMAPSRQRLDSKLFEIRAGSRSAQATLEQLDRLQVKLGQAVDTQPQTVRNSKKR